MSAQNLLKSLSQWLQYVNSYTESNELSSVTIESCDNPGWWVKIDLSHTNFANCPFKRQEKNISLDGHSANDTDWLACYVENGIFNGAGDPNKLEDILTIFFNWVNEHSDRISDALKSDLNVDAD